ncbi:hypothetical protein HY404_00460 [Candidatus Microgenomates bacterium]|nr:hypothetical protein [Candidatus Microgenomates bacterium]
MKKEVYTPVSSIQIRGFTHDAIQGVKASTNQSPFKDGHLPQFAVVGIENKVNEEENHTLLRKISSYHGRSYEMVTGGIYNEIIWLDEFGNLFTTLSTKGNNCTTCEINSSDSSPSGLIIHGLQDSNSIVRILRASEIMRSHNIDTESIVKVIEPAELPYQGELIPLAEFKNRLVKDVWEENATEGTRSSKTGWHKMTRQEITQITKNLHDMTLFITIRAHQIPERLVDLLEFENSDEEAINYITIRALRFINLDEYLKSKKDKNGTYVFRGEPDNLEFYLTDYLPRRIAQNLAIMHQAGLVHRYLHTGNISLVGSIYDLDSVRGTPLGLGDPEITEEDKLYDASYFIDNNSNFPSPTEIFKELGFEKSETFTVNFLREYIRLIGWEGEISKFYYIAALVVDSKNHLQVIDEQLWNYYFQMIVSRYNLFPLDNPQDVLKFYAGEFLSLLKDREGSDMEMALEVFRRVICDKLTQEVFGPEAIFDDLDKITQQSLQYLTLTFTLKMQNALNDVLEDKELSDIFSQKIEDDVTKGRFEKFKLEFKKEFCRRMGWEGDILEYLEDINEFFYNFDMKNDRPYYFYFIAKLEEQLGIKFVATESLEEIITMFHQYDQEEARDRLEYAFEGVGSNEIDRKQLITTAWDRDETDPLSQNFTWDHLSRYYEFVIDYFEEKVREENKDKFAEIREKYGDDTLAVVVEWLVQETLDIFINNLPDKINNKIERQSETRLKRLKKKFLSPTKAASA